MPLDTLPAGCSTALEMHGQLLTQLVNWSHRASNKRGTILDESSSTIGFCRLTVILLSKAEEMYDLRGQVTYFYPGVVITGTLG